jgi:hypothetical protein
MVKKLDSLLESDGYEQSDDDGRDMDEEVLPGVGCFMGSVDVEHYFPCSDSGAERTYWTRASRKPS